MAGSSRAGSYIEYLLYHRCNIIGCNNILCRNTKMQENDNMYCVKFTQNVQTFNLGFYLIKNVLNICCKGERLQAYVSNIFRYFQSSRTMNISILVNCFLYVLEVIIKSNILTLLVLYRVVRSASRFELNHDQCIVTYLYSIFCLYYN